MEYYLEHRTGPDPEAGADLPIFARDVAESRCVVARRQGGRGGPELLIRSAWKSREKNLGPNHPDTAGSLNNLAGVAGSERGLRGRRALVPPALGDSEKTLGPNHPNHGYGAR